MMLRVTCWLPGFRNAAAVVNTPRTAETVFVAQERAYPGWRVEVNGQPAPLKSYGGLVAVELPAGDAPVYVYFEYRPPLLLTGGWISVLTGLMCIVYLMFGKRLLVSLWSVARRSKSVLG